MDVQGRSRREYACADPRGHCGALVTGYPIAVAFVHALAIFARMGEGGVSCDSSPANRLNDNGAAIKADEPNMITKVKVKDDVIEIHLGGGGYGTFGDKFGSPVTNKGADSGNAQQARIANQPTQASSAGSRFNLHYPNGATPAELTVASVIHALQDYATFPPSLIEVAAPAPAQAAQPTTADGGSAGAAKRTASQLLTAPRAAVPL